MKSIYKYRLGISNTQVVAMPIGAEVIHVDVQNEELCLWALVDPNANPVSRRISTYGTGHSMPDLVGRHVGSVLTIGGSLVLHVFDEGVV